MRRPYCLRPHRAARGAHTGPLDLWSMPADILDVSSSLPLEAASVSIERSGPSEAALGLPQLSERSREIFRRIVESYLETGEPVGSRNLSRVLPMTLSPASVRNVMSDLEALGLVYAPHISAGRLPTELGLRLFVDSLLEFGDLTEAERSKIDAQVKAGGSGRTLEGVLIEAGNLLSGLSRGAGVVLAIKADPRMKHIEFVRLDPMRALVVLVGEDGSVENRVLDLPPGLPSSALIEAANYLNAHIRGKTLGEARAELERLQKEARAALDELTHKIVEAGLASWSGEGGQPQTLIVRGSANLLEDLKTLDDLERIRLLFEDLERKQDIVQLLGLAERAEGVRIFIGSENKLFSLSGSSLVVSPFRNSHQKIVGVLGVIGPTRLNYARVVPMVDYTAKVVSRILD
jgi:heat-inducible transcriptional repressor